MSPRHGRMLLLAACAAAAVFPGTMASAANPPATESAPEEGLVVLEQRHLPVEQFHFDPLDWTLDLEAVYQHSSVESGGAKSTSDEWIFSQLVGVGTHGYYIHPNVLDLHLWVSGGLTETYDKIDGQSSNSIDTVSQWDISGTLFRNGDWPLTVYSHRDEEWVFRPFGSALHTETTDTGANLSHHSETMDQSLTVDHIEQTQTGDGPFDNSSYTQDRLAYHGNAQLGPQQRLDWSYNYSDIQQSGDFSNSYKEQDATVTHQAQFGEGNLSSLDSSLYWTQQTGLADYQQFRWDERLQLWHSDSLTSRYNYTFDRYDVSGFTRDDNRLEAGFTHHLYQSLTTTGNVGVLETDGSDGFSSTDKYANINWDYIKKVPYGNLSANVGLGWDNTDSSASGAVRVVNQPATFTDPLPVVLVGNNIDPKSIVITDPSGFLLLPGVDYNVSSFPDRVEIQRIIGGRIGSGDSVLIDYTATPTPATTIDSTSFSTGIRYDFTQGPFNGLGFYLRYAKVDQSVSPQGPDAPLPNNYTDVIYGTEYRLLDLTLGAEKQHHDSNILPYDASRLWGRFTHDTGATTWSLSSAYTQINYPDENNTDTLYTVAAGVSQRFSTHLNGTANILWRDETDDLFGKTTGFQEQLQLNWTYRQLEAYLQVDASQLDTDSSKSRFEFVRIGIRRTF